MTTYADYEAIVKAYDEDKLATCSSLYFWAFLKLNKPLKDLHILDAGCRTGKYALAMLEAGVGHVTLMDGHHSFLEKAKEKCKTYIDSGHASPKLHSIPKLPFEEGIFDCVMYNNTFHRHALTHSKYSYFQTVILEARRVLKPGGLLLLNMTFPNQYQQGYWYFHLARNVMQFFAENQLTQDETIDMLKSSMLQDPQILVETTALYLPKELYFDPEGPLNERVSRADSFWTKLSNAEKAEIGKKVLSMRKAGAMRRFMKDNDKDRTKVGQISLVLASKRMETVSTPLW
jgi:ubiquinone/menaquinone biosynthesis C-methylase UbiE